MKNIKEYPIRRSVSIQALELRRQLSLVSVRNFLIFPQTEAHKHKESVVQGRLRLPKQLQLPSKMQSMGEARGNLPMVVLRIPLEILWFS